MEAGGCTDIPHTATANSKVANAPTFATAPRSHVNVHYVPLLIRTAHMHATASDDTHTPTQT